MQSKTECVTLLYSHLTGKYKKKWPNLVFEHMSYSHRSSGSETEANTSCTGCIRIGIASAMSALTKEVEKGYRGKKQIT